MRFWERTGRTFAGRTIGRRDVLRGLGGAAAGAALATLPAEAVALVSGCGGTPMVGGGGSGSAGAFFETNSNPQPVPSGTQNLATVTIGTSQYAPVAQGVCGFSFEKDGVWNGTLSTANTDLIACLQRCSNYYGTTGQGVIRVGGNSVDICRWTGSGTGGQTHLISATDVANFCAFVNQLGWKLIYGINLAGVWHSPVQQSTANAIAEVQALLAHLNSGLLLEIEIGNEPDDYYKNYPSVTESVYFTQWSAIATAINGNSQTSGVKLSGPALADEGNMSAWSTPFMSSVRAHSGMYNLDLLTQHRYQGASGDASSTTAALLQDVSYFDGKMTDMQTLAYNGGTKSVGWRLAESSTYFNTTTGSHAADFAGAMWLIEEIFVVLENKGLGVNIHGGDSFQFAPLNTTPTSGSTPPGVSSVNALYYGALIFYMAGAGNAVSTTPGSCAINYGAHTIKTSAGVYSTFLMNKDTSGSNYLKVTLNYPSTISNTTSRMLSAPSMDSQTGMVLQYHTVHTDGSFIVAADYTAAPSGSSVVVYVPANAMMLVQTTLA